MNKDGKPDSESSDDVKDLISKLFDDLDSIAELAIAPFDQQIKEHKRQIDFTKGIAFGLIYGIIGNLFVQFFYPVVEGIVVSRYDNLLLSNLIISIVSFVIIIFTTLQFRKQLRTHEKVIERTQEAIDTYDKSDAELREHIRKLAENT